MCIRMALSCIFCAADHEAQNAYDETMRSYRAPTGNLASVREATSSQERGSSEVGRNEGVRRSSDDNGQLTNDEARRRGRKSEERVNQRRSEERRSAERRSSERPSEERKSREERISDEINRQMSGESVSNSVASWHVEKMPAPLVESVFQKAKPRLPPMPPVPDRPSLEAVYAGHDAA